jgi:hypothetical protein
LSVLLLIIVLCVLRFTASDYPFIIFKFYHCLYFCSRSEYNWNTVYLILKMNQSGISAIILSWTWLTSFQAHCLKDQTK